MYVAGTGRWSVRKRSSTMSMFAWESNVLKFVILIVVKIVVERNASFLSICRVNFRIKSAPLTNVVYSAWIWSNGRSNPSKNQANRDVALYCDTMIGFTVILFL